MNITFELTQEYLIEWSRLLGTKYRIYLQKTMETDEYYLRVGSRISDLFRKSLPSGYVFLPPYRLTFPHQWPRTADSIAQFAR